MTYWITNKIIAAYIFSSLAFLIIILFFKTPRRRTNFFLNKSNLIIVIVLLLNIIFVGEETIRCIVSEGKNTETFGEETATFYIRNCTTIFTVTFFFAFLFQSLFFFNRHRIKVSFTIISILLLTVMCNYERLVIYIMQVYIKTIYPQVGQHTMTGKGHFGQHCLRYHILHFAGLIK